MNFIEALEKLKIGRKLRRPFWGDKVYIYYHSESGYVYYHNKIRHSFEMEEFFVNDWEELKEEFIINEANCYYKLRNGRICKVVYIHDDGSEHVNTPVIYLHPSGAFISVTIEGMYSIVSETLGSEYDIVEKIGKELL